MDNSVKLTRRHFLLSSLGLFASVLSPKLAAKNSIRQIPLQYIACLAPEDAQSGTGAETWGHWEEDPGPIGVWLSLFQVFRQVGFIGPSGWRFNINDWWLDENGLIMKAPTFPMPAGKYYVTNGEENFSWLTVEEADKNGKQAWSLSHDKTIADVTHGPCRSARYTPIDGKNESCTPENVDRSIFPLKAGEDTPEVKGCHRQKFAVLIIVALPNEG